MNSEISESFSQLVKSKGMDKDVLAGIIEDIFGLLVRKRYGEEANFDIVVNMDRGDIEIYLVRNIVEEVEDPNREISIEEVNVRGNEDDLGIGDEFVEQLKLESFGRRMVNLAKQSLNQRIREIEKDIIYNEYHALLGEIVIGDVYQQKKNFVLVNHNKNELLMPISEQIPRERYLKNKTLRAIVKEVRKGSSGPEIIISRADNNFLRKLFEIEIPEIYDGIIEIKAIAREPGMRAKVAVESRDKRIDAVGACVGMKGVRIHAIVRELNNENIDVINYSKDPFELLRKALEPGKIKNIEIDEAQKKATIYADENQAAMIVGSGGVNIRLAMALTGYYIDFIREVKEVEVVVEDFELIDIKEKLGKDLWAILIKNRYDNAREVLDAGEEKLLQIEDITPEQVEHIFAVIKEEFEDTEESEEEEE